MKKIILGTLFLLTLSYFGKADTVSEKNHRFKSLEIELTGVEMEYGRNELLDADRVLKNIYLKVTDFKLTDFNGNIYTKNNYPGEKRMSFIPEIITDETFNRFLVDNNVNVKFTGSEKKNKKTGRTVLDTVPTKLILENKNGFYIYATPDGKKLYYDLEKLNQ